MSNAIKRYMKELRHLLPFCSKTERVFLADIKSAALDLAAQDPTIDYDYLCLYIGRPQDLIINYYSEVDPEYLSKKLNLSSFIRKVVIVIAIIVLLFVTYRGILIYDAYTDAQNAIITKEVITIE